MFCAHSILRADLYYDVRRIPIEFQMPISYGLLNFCGQNYGIRKGFPQNKLITAKNMIYNIKKTLLITLIQEVLKNWRFDFLKIFAAHIRIQILITLFVWINIQK